MGFTHSHQGLHKKTHLAASGLLPMPHGLFTVTRVGSLNAASQSVSLRSGWWWRRQRKRLVEDVVMVRQRARPWRGSRAGKAVHARRDGHAEDVRESPAAATATTTDAAHLHRVEVVVVVPATPAGEVVVEGAAVAVRVGCAVVGVHAF